MAEMLFKTRGNASPSGKPRVYFTCHSDDFGLYFEQVCEYIFKSHDCAVYYTADMNETINDEDKVTDLESNNLFVVPVTFKLLSTENRAMDDVRFALEKHIPVLPLMMESGLDAIYSRPDKFGELQYLSPFSSDATEVSFEEKLRKYLESVLVSDEMAKRVRAAFDAYIFLSYRKKDRKYANQLMRIIHSKPECHDIAIWYDEFLTPGESFRENIDKILADSKLFTLLVTPNLLEEHNFVMEQEYPAAVKSGIEILPAEMEETDKNILAEKYANLPEISNPYNDEEFRKRLVDTLSNIALKSNDTDPEHNFLIGLAYLDGIDVEVNRERALELITKAADANLSEAIVKLYDMYQNGINVTIDYRKAAELALKLVNCYTYKYGESDKTTLSWISNLAFCNRLIGNYSKAVELNKKVYQLRLKLFGENNPDTLTSLSNLGSSYYYIGNFTQATAINEKLYQLTLKRYGEIHPDTLISLNNLAASYESTNNYEKAIELNEKAYQISLQLFGKESPNSLIILSNLASAYQSIGDYHKSIEINETVYELRLKILGENHPDTSISLNNLASSFNSIKNYSKAIEYVEKAYQMRFQILGETHPDTLKTLSNLALYLYNYKSYVRSAEAYEKLFALHASLSLFENNNDLMIIAINNSATAYRKANKLNKSCELYERLYRLCYSILGKNNMNTLKALSKYSYSLADIGKHKEAIEMYTILIDNYLKLFGNNDSRLITELNNLSYSFMSLKQYSDAIKCYTQIYKIKLSTIGETDSSTIKTLIRIGEIYQYMGKTEQAVECFEKAYKIRLETLGADHEDTIAVKKLLDEIK